MSLPAGLPDVQDSMPAGIAFTQWSIVPIKVRFGTGKCANL